MSLPRWIIDQRLGLISNMHGARHSSRRSMSQIFLGMFFSVLVFWNTVLFMASISNPETPFSLSISTINNLMFINIKAQIKTPNKNLNKKPKQIKVSAVVQQLPLPFLSLICWFGNCVCIKTADVLNLPQQLSSIILLSLLKLFMFMFIN